MYPKIKELREQHSFTQQQTAEILNMALSTYRSYETGVREPGVDTLMNLSELYGVSVDYLLDHKPKPLVFDSEEINHIKKYRILDEYGKKAVSSVLDVEYERCNKAITSSDAKPTIPSFRAANSVNHHEPEIVEMKDLSAIPESDSEEI